MKINNTVCVYNHNFFYLFLLLLLCRCVDACSCVSVCVRVRPHTIGSNAQNRRLDNPLSSCVRVCVSWVLRAEVMQCLVSF